jgi:uncharacterized lipoprotein YmbA
MKTRYRHIVRTFVCCTALALAGCGRSPQANFYTLATDMSSRVAIPSVSGPTVVVAPVTLPELVDRPQLVVRIDASRVDILEMHRWAEPLKSTIPRLLAENLSCLFGTDRVSTYLQNAAIEADYRVSVDIRRFQSMGNFVNIDAVWTIRKPRGGTSKTGRSQIIETIGAGGYEELVSAYSRALVAVSNDIALSIRTEWAASR